MGLKGLSTGEGLLHEDAPFDSYITYLKQEDRFSHLGFAYSSEGSQ